MMMKPFSYNRPGRWGDPTQESSVVNVLAGAGQTRLPGRSIKRTLQLRYTAHVNRIRGVCGCRARTDWAKAIPAAKKSSKAAAGTTGVRAAAWGERTGGVNWGPSAAGELVSQPGGIIHNPPGGRQRRGCGHSKPRAGRTIEPAGEPRATGRACGVRSRKCRPAQAGLRKQTLTEEISAVTVLKPAKAKGTVDSPLEAVLGKTRRTEL